MGAPTLWAPNPSVARKLHQGHLQSQAMLCILQHQTIKTGCEAFLETTAKTRVDISQSGTGMRTGGCLQNPQIDPKGINQ